jgi:hypothetical protein
VVGLKRPYSGGILPVEPANKEFSSRDKLQGDGNIDFLIAIRADELPVIKDSKALQDVGKNAEVFGLVVSVTISRFGTACIIFGREYPDQTFAGFIVSAQESLTLVARKTIPLLMVALSLILTASHSMPVLAGLSRNLSSSMANPF